MEEPFLLIWVAASLITVKNEWVLLLALVILKDSVPIAEYNVKMWNCAYLYLPGILTTKPVHESLLWKRLTWNFLSLILISKSKN